jgi:O-antigen/teichoic acid export membrane protein
VSDASKLTVTYQRFFKVLVLLGWPLTVGTFVLVHPINQIFNRSGAFAQSEPALRILSLGIVFLFANSAFYAMLNAINRQGLNAWATALAAGVNILLNLALIPLFGYLGASTVTVVTEAALCAFGWWFVQLKRPELRLPVVKLTWRIVLCGLIMGAVLFPVRSVSIFITVPAGAIVYLVAAIVLRAVEPDEYEMAAESLLSRLQRNPPRVIVVGDDGKA